MFNFLSEYLKHSKIVTNGRIDHTILLAIDRNISIKTWNICLYNGTFFTVFKQYHIISFLSDDSFLNTLYCKFLRVSPICYKQISTSFDFFG